MTSEDVLVAVCKLAFEWFKNNPGNPLSKRTDAKSRLYDQLEAALDYHHISEYGTQEAVSLGIKCTRSTCVCPACIVREAKGLCAESVEVGPCPNCGSRDLSCQASEAVRCGSCHEYRTDLLADAPSDQREAEGERLVGDSGMPTPPGYGPDQVEGEGADKPRGACSDTACPRYGRCPYAKAKAER